MYICTNTIQRVYIGKRHTKVIYTSPKTQKSIRKIPISNILYNQLKSISKKYSRESFILSGDENKYVELIK